MAGNNNKTNLVEETFDASQPDNTFEYMAQAFFTTTMPTRLFLSIGKMPPAMNSRPF